MAFAIAGLGVAIFALVSVVISLALEYWIYYSRTSSGKTYKAYSGLFKACVEFGAKTCESEAGSDAQKRVAAMLFFALYYIVAAIVCGGLKLFIMKEQKHLLYAAIGMMAAAGLFLMIGFAVYAAEVYGPIKSVYDLHAGFAFCVLAWIASWVSAGLFGVEVIKSKYSCTRRIIPY